MYGIYLIRVVIAERNVESHDYLQPQCKKKSTLLFVKCLC